MLQKGDQKKNTSNSTPKSLDVKVILIHHYLKFLHFSMD